MHNAAFPSMCPLHDAIVPWAMDAVFRTSSEGPGCCGVSCTNPNKSYAFEILSSRATHQCYTPHT
eukprot:1161282-Pelagomonas_calceolata.AAC.5